MGKSLIPQLSGDIEQRIRIAQDRTPEEIAQRPGLFTMFEGGPVPDPYAFRSPGPIEAGLTLGASDLAMQMAQPANLAFIAMIPLIFQVPALAMMAQVGITASVLIHAIQKTPEIIELWKTGQIEQAVRLTTNVGLELPIAYFAGRGAARSFKGRLYDPIVDLRGKRAAEARQRRMPATVEEPIELDIRGRPAEPFVIPPEGAIDIPAREVTTRATEPPGAPQVEPQITGVREPGLRPRPPETVFPEDRLRGLTAEGPPVGFPRPPSPMEEPIVTPVRAVEPTEPGQDVYTVEKVPDAVPTEGDWGVFLQQKGEGPRELVRQFRIRQAAWDWATQQEGLMPVVVEPPKTKLDEVVDELDEAREGIEGGPALTGNLPADRQAIARFYEAIYAENVRLMRAGEIPPEEAVLKNQLNTQRWDAALAKLESKPAEPTPPRKEPMVDVEAAPEPGLPTWSYSKVGDGWDLYQTMPGENAILVDRTKTEKQAKAVIRKKMAAQKTLIEQRRKLKQAAEPTVKPERVWSVEKLGDLKWAVYQKDIGYRKRKMAEYTTRREALAHRDRGGPDLEAAPPEMKVGLRSGQKENIEIGKGRGGVPRGIQIERDTEGNIMARIMATGEPTGTGSKWIAIEGRWLATEVAEARKVVFLEAKRAFIKDRLKATKKGVGSTTAFEKNRSVFWNEESDLILKLDEATAVRPDVVAKERVGTGEIWDYAIRPDLVQGRLGWVPVMRKPGGTWEPAGIGRVPNITAENYDTAVGRIHDALADRTGVKVDFIDPVAKELEATRLEEIEAAKTAEELEKATEEKRVAARVEKAEARAQVARSAFKEVTPKEAPKFVAAVQHRKILKPLAENAFTIVKDGIATSSNGEITIMTRTDLADGVYTPFVKGDNKAFRKLKVASGVVAQGPDPVAAEGKQGRITIEASSNDLKRIRRVVTAEPSRYSLNSFKIEPVDAGKIRIIATDGHRLVINTIPYEGKIKNMKSSWLVDGRSLDIILKEKKGTKVELLLDEDAVSLIGQNIAVSNKITGDFPSWEAVVPKTLAHELAISKQVLADILKKARIEQLDDEANAIYFTRTPEGLDVQVHYDTTLKLEEIQITYAPGSKEAEALIKDQKKGLNALRDLVPEYGSIGVIPFTQRKPGLTTNKSEITIQMPIQDKDITSEFAYNRKYLEDILAGITDPTVLLGLSRSFGDSQGVFTGAEEAPPTTTTYKPPTKKQKSAADLMSEPPAKFTEYIKDRRKSDMALDGKIGETTRYAIDLGHFLDGALKNEPIMPAVLQTDKRGLQIEDQVKKWYDERNQEAKAARAPKGGEGAMVPRFPELTDADVSRIGKRVKASEADIQKAMNQSNLFLDEQEVEEWFAAQLLGPGRFKAAGAAKGRAIEREKPPLAGGEAVVVSEAQELTGEERLLQAIAGPKPVPEGLVTTVRPVGRLGGRPPEPKVKATAKQLKLQAEEGEEFFMAAEEAKRLGEGAMAGRLDRPGPPGRKPVEPVVKPVRRKKLTLEEIRDETLTLQAATLKRMGEGAMAGRMDRPGPPGRKPPPPMPPKPPAAPPGGEPPEPPGEALSDARRMAAGLEPKRKSLMALIKEQPLRVQRLFTSEFQPLKYWQDIIYKEQGLELPLTNIARKFELQAGAHGKARADVYEFDLKVTDLLPKNSRLDFDTYVVMERMRDRFLDNPTVKRVKGWTLERADRGIRELQGDIGSKDFEIIRAVAHNEYQEMMDRSLRLQVTSGRLSRENYDQIKKHNPFYGPFKILLLIEEIEALPGTGRNIATTQAYTRAIRGIDEDDVVFESILKLSREMVYQSRILAEKNRKMLELDKLMEMGGESNPFKKADPDRYFQIHYKPAEDILHQLAMQETARTGRQTLEHSLMKVGLAIELADSVGLKLKQRNLISSLGRATIGGVDTRGRVNLMAFTSDVIAHELGHSFDVPLRDQKTGQIITKEKKVFGVERNIVQRLSTVINLRKGVAFGKQGIFQKELMELVKFTKLGGTPAYRAKATERFSEFVNLYIHDPKQARKLAPQWTDFFEKEILPKQKIKRLVESLGAFFQKADKLPNIMDDIKDMNGLKYIELAIRRAFPEKKPQLGVRFGTKPKKGQEILFYLKDGKRMAMEMPAQEARAVRGLHREEASAAGNWMRLFSQPLRLGATAYNVRFQLRNLLAADLPRATLMSRYGLSRPDDVHRALTDWTYALYSAFKLNLGTPNKLGMDFLKSGAANSGIQSAISPKTFDPTVERNWAMKVLDTPGRISQAIEETSKMFGLRRALRHEGMLEIPDLSKIDDMPTEEALELIDYIAVEIRNYSGSPDFLRGGQLVTGPHADNLNFLFMFLRARIQGQASDITRVTGYTGKDEARAAWIRLTPLFLAATALALYHRLDANKEDFDKRAKWETDNYFMFERFNEDGTPKMIMNERGELIRDYYRWPKREITQLVGNFVEASVNFAYEQDPEAVKDFAITFLENISPVSVSGKDLQERAESIASGLNPLFKVPIEFGLGRDTFRHRRVVPQYIEGVPSRRLSPSQQYTSTTPDIFIKLGEASGIAPLIIEQMVRGATAGLITQFAPRARPGRPRVLSLPLIGPVLGSFVGSEYLATEADEELEAALTRQSDRQVNINRKAQQIHEAWVAEDPKPFSLTDFVREQGGTEEHWVKVQDIIEDVRLGLTYNERLIKQLQIGNGERALYIAEKAVAIPLGEERSAYFQDLQQKKILTPEMVPRMNSEIRRLEGEGDERGGL